MRLVIIEQNIFTRPNRHYAEILKQVKEGTTSRTLKCDLNFPSQAERNKLRKRRFLEDLKVWGVVF
ncbi:MAG: hypothetical protein CM15mV112_050 [uncultured marine virus]|nr:MAG: hypothetical protein CM15mV112_050 [uncultured marine virus]